MITTDRPLMITADHFIGYCVMAVAIAIVGWAIFIIAGKE
jgi:hypothetical protein